MPLLFQFLESKITEKSANTISDLFFCPLICTKSMLKLIKLRATIPMTKPSF